MIADFDRSIVKRTAHRPWPIPDGPWLMSQTWNDLLFAHWRVDPAELRRAVPRSFELDLFDNDAWVGVVPFYMTNVALRAMPPLPWLSAFPELNVRTYVRVGDRPGIYFFSLDAGRWLGVAAARLLLNLPYHHATMSIGRRPDGIHYHSVRRTQNRAEFSGTYDAMGPPSTASPGSLDHFLTERYCLYHHDRAGRPYRLDIHHPPWSLQPARATVETNTMAAANRLSISGAPALLHFASRQDAVAWAPQRLDAAISGVPGR